MLLVTSEQMSCRRVESGQQDGPALLWKHNYVRQLLVRSLGNKRQSGEKLLKPMLLGDQQQVSSSLLASGLWSIRLGSRPIFFTCRTAAS